MILLSVLLVLAVAVTWLGCAGFARLRAPLDRLHCVAFVNASAGLCLTVAAFVADGASARSLKTLLILLASLAAGAVQSHAVARALVYRAGHPKQDDA